MSTDAQKMAEACAAAASMGPEHQSLARFEGTWRAEVKLWMQPGAEPQVSQGTMTNTLVLGGLIHHLAPILQPTLHGGDSGVGGHAEDALAHLLVETVHHREHHDERHDTEHDPQHRRRGYEADEVVAAPRAGVAQTEIDFPGSEHGAH